VAHQPPHMIQAEVVRPSSPDNCASEGVLQVATGWASFTSDNMRAVIDSANPLTPESARLTVWLGNAEPTQVSIVDPAKIRVTVPQR
jgi:hypothetical protein